MSALLTNLRTGDLVLTAQALTLTDGPTQFCQRVNSRLRMNLSEWFLDVTDGTDWKGSVLIKNPINAESIIKARIAGTPGYISLTSFSLTINKAGRAATISYRGTCQGGIYQGEAEFTFPSNSTQTFIFQT